LRDWVHRYNADGLEGLSNQPRRNGPRPRLSAEQQANIVALVVQGPDFEQHDVVRWRCVDLQKRIREEFSVELHESTVGKLLGDTSCKHVEPPGANADRTVADLLAASERVKATPLGRRHRRRNVGLLRSSDGDAPEASHLLAFRAVNVTV
jgi:transposase